MSNNRKTRRLAILAESKGRYRIAAILWTRAYHAHLQANPQKTKANVEFRQNLLNRMSACWNAYIDLTRNSKQRTAYIAARTYERLAAPIVLAAAKALEYDAHFDGGEYSGEFHANYLEKELDALAWRVACRFDINLAELQAAHNERWYRAVYTAA